MEHPNPKQHQRISFLKSALRLIGYLLLLPEPFTAITVLVCILWFIIIIQIFNILYYYYRDIYSYILLFITILTILIAIIWKMIYILNVD